MKNIYVTSMLLCFTLLVSLSALAQPKDTTFVRDIWHGYEGKIGSSDIQMALFFFKNGQVKGNYVYKKDDIKILVKGSYNNNEVVLTELMNGSPDGYELKSTKWDSYNSNFCEGDRSDTLGKKADKFILQSTGYGGHSYKHMYPEVDSDAYLEGFMKHVKESVLKGDKAWIAYNVNYPINIYIHTGKGDEWKTLLIDTPNNFIKKFDVIFNSALKNKIKNDVPYDLSGSSKGYMLGNGDIWITPQISGDIKITAINN